MILLYLLENLVITHGAVRIKIYQKYPLQEFSCGVINTTEIDDGQQATDVSDGIADQLEAKGDLTEGDHTIVGFCTFSFETHAFL